MKGLLSNNSFGIPTKGVQFFKGFSLPFKGFQLSALWIQVITWFNAYVLRVEADSGNISDSALTKDYYAQNIETGSIVFGWAGFAGRKLRTSTIYSYFTKIYSLFPKAGSYGDELVTNGNFDSDVGWLDTGGTWIVSNGTLICNIADNSKFYYRTDVAYTHGSNYIIVIIVNSISTGYINILAGNVQMANITTPGTYIYYTNNTSNTNINIRNVLSDAIIDNVSVKEVLVKDGTQTTEANQPYLSGNIAPNENEGMLNENGDDCFIEHDTISFAADEEWSVTCCINWNSSDETNESFIGDITSANSSIFLRLGDVNKFRITNSSGSTQSGTVDGTNDIIGKNTVLTFVAAGDGSILIYKNGVFFETITISSEFIFNSIIQGHVTVTSFLKYNAHFIRNKAPTPAQVLAEANYLIGKYPPVPNVLIGTDIWATDNFRAFVTCLGTVIKEMTAAANVEKISGGDFEGGLIGSIFQGDETSTWTLNTTNPISGSQDGLLQVTFIGTDVQKPTIQFSENKILGKWYRLAFNYKVNSGTCILYRIHTGGGLITLNVTLSGTGIFKYWYLCDGSTDVLVYFNGTNLFNAQLDNISDEEVGRDGLVDLYNGLISQGESVQTALEATAVWMYPNNDMALGAIYGKIYSKFTAKLLKADIDTYNASNPDWGYHVSSRAELTTLSSQGGNACKMSGTNYWATDNGINTNGFTALGTGYTDSSGAYQNNKDSLYLLCEDADFVREIKDGDNTFDEVAITVECGSIRLIKD